MGEVEGQDGGGRGRAGSVYMLNERGAIEASQRDPTNDAE